MFTSFNQFLADRAAKTAAAQKAADELKAKVEAQALADKHGLGATWATAQGRFEEVKERQTLAAEKSAVLDKIEAAQAATVSIAEDMAKARLLPAQIQERRDHLEAEQSVVDDFLKNVGLL